MSTTFWIKQHQCQGCLDVNGGYFQHFLWCIHNSRENLKTYYCNFFNIVKVKNEKLSSVLDDIPCTGYPKISALFFKFNTKSSNIIKECSLDWNAYHNEKFSSSNWKWLVSNFNHRWHHLPVCLLSKCVFFLIFTLIFMQLQEMMTASIEGFHFYIITSKLI